MWHHLTDISNGTSGSKAMPRMVIVVVCRAIVFHWNCVYTWLDCVATIILQHWCLHYIVRGSQSNCGSRMLRITGLELWPPFNEDWRVFMPCNPSVSPRILSLWALRMMMLSDPDFQFPSLSVERLKKSMGWSKGRIYPLDGAKKWQIDFNLFSAPCQSLEICPRQTAGLNLKWIQNGFSLFLSPHWKLSIGSINLRGDTSETWESIQRSEVRYLSGPRVIPIPALIPALLQLWR